MGVGRRGEVDAVDGSWLGCKVLVEGSDLALREVCQGVAEGVMLFSVAAGLENSLTMAKSSLLLSSRWLARVSFLVLFKRRWHRLRAVLKDVRSSGVLLEQHLLSCCLQLRFSALSSS